MWKLYFMYEDGGKITISGKGDAMARSQYTKYMNNYGRSAKQALYQRYPKKNYTEPCDLKGDISEKMIEVLGYYPPVPFCTKHYTLAGVCYCAANRENGMRPCPFNSPDEARTGKCDNLVLQ